jgi:hypothetical protein
MQPGRSGEYAEKPVLVGSMRTRKRCKVLLLVADFQAGLLENAT